jgi:hypothetical protein
VNRLDKAADLLSDFGIEKMRCFVLMGFNGDDPEMAENRCERIYEKGFLPFAQYYQLNDSRKRTATKEWQKVIRKWSRPAAYRSKKNER